MEKIENVNLGFGDSANFVRSPGGIWACEVNGSGEWMRASRAESREIDRDMELGQGDLSLAEWAAGFVD